ncbi:hypothetical protein AB0395_28810 [Streptosporangium sp. NPDC051023]|uniref:hypothetical protein n=1 Tax=Streptosporangium sp. NPDC051023 TaxID=3155410 RepID=UPI00344DB2E1
MTGAERYRQAEVLLEAAEDTVRLHDGSSPEAALLLAEAQVHATLAAIPAGSQGAIAVARQTLEEFDRHRPDDMSRVSMAFWLGQLSHALRGLVSDGVEMVISADKEKDYDAEDERAKCVCGHLFVAEHQGLWSRMPGVKSNPHPESCNKLGCGCLAPVEAQSSPTPGGER